jgi:hypothetical protein
MLSPKPTGEDAVLQTVWEGRRKSLVEGHLRMKTLDDARRHWISHVIETLKKPGDVMNGQLMMFHSGSYSIEKDVKDGELNAMIRLINANSDLATLLHRKKLTFGKFGVRTSGCMLYSDGSREYLAPGGHMISTTKIPIDIRRVQTLYAFIVKA